MAVVLPKIDLRGLIVFYLVASEGSITSAADKLCLTQPAVTYHIRSLERTVRLKLLDVRRQKVSLTPAGAGLFKYAREIYQQMTSAEKYLEDLREGSLRIGVGFSVSTIVALAVAKFEEIYPHVRLIVRNSPSFDVAEDVLSSQVDLGIVVGLDYKKPKLRAIPISARERLALVVSSSSPVPEKERLEIADLCGYPLVAAPETSATRQIILSKFEAEGLKVPPLITAEVNSLEGGLSLVESGRGMGLFHIKLVEKKIAEGQLKELPLSDDILVGVNALFHVNGPEHPVAGKFVALVRKVFTNNG
jgi:DNA-binding transcriptional LysR family regulator